MPKSQVSVVCQFLTGKEEKEIAFISEKQKKHNLPEKPSTDLLKTMITYVNGNPKKDYIYKFVDTALAYDLKWLRTIYKKLMPNLELIETFRCTSCSYEEEVEVPLGTEFFWPQR